MTTTSPGDNANKESICRDIDTIPNHFNWMTSDFMLLKPLKGGGSNMTRPNRTPKQPCCPHCQAKLKSLYYLAHQSISGEFTLARGHEDNLCPNLERRDYSCPKCGAGLFEDEAHAEAFLLGQEAPATLLDKKRA
jgi:hypothetical protein